MLLIRMHNLENLCKTWELTVFFCCLKARCIITREWGRLPSLPRPLSTGTVNYKLPIRRKCVELYRRQSLDSRLETWVDSVLVWDSSSSSSLSFFLVWSGLCSGLVWCWDWGLVRRVSCCMHFFYGSETKAERVKLQLGCPLLLLLLLLLLPLLPKRTSAKSYRAVSKKKEKKKRQNCVYLFACCRCWRRSRSQRRRFSCRRNWNESANSSCFWFSNTDTYICTYTDSKS